MHGKDVKVGCGEDIPVRLLLDQNTGPPIFEKEVLWISSMCLNFEFREA